MDAVLATVPLAVPFTYVRIRLFGASYATVTWYQVVVFP